MQDILFREADAVFSYRVAGICIQDGKVLLQSAPGDPGFAFPGGHVAFGETHEETLRREFQEEIGAQIAVGELKWVAELFFPWGEKPCQQICLYYLVELRDTVTPRAGSFRAKEKMDTQVSELEFHWIPLEQTAEISIYPNQAAGLLADIGGAVRHFIYREL